MTDTIAAIATPMAPSAIGILRLSGPEAVSAASAVFRPRRGKPLEDCPSHTLIHGALLDREGRVIDDALATYSPAPHSYTGEDTAELHCHGAPAVLALALEALFAHGARQALAGEFTRRAFLNGKLDLMQAEGVADLLSASSPAGVRLAAEQLSGGLSRRVEGIYQGLTDLLAHFCAVLDYPDEDLDPFRAETIQRALEEAKGGLKSLLSTYRRGRSLVGGVPCAIVGRPNVGKSSLLNALLGWERAIVTSVPGTTRDTVEGLCQLGGVPFRLMDTAGLREGADEAERLGVERSRTALEGAELVLLVLSGAEPLEAEDEAVLRLAEGREKVVCVVNKADLPCRLDLEGLRRRFPHLCQVSARQGTGLEELEALAASLFPLGGGNEEALLTNARQAEAAGRALERVEAAAEAFNGGVTPDAVLSEVEGALEALASLTGRRVQEDVTERVFARFCVGK